MVAFFVLLAILAAVVVLVSAPLRAARPGPEPSGELTELSARREAKYREIRDAELDRATGKLSDPDFQAIDTQLRAEAVEILDGIERLSDSAPDDV